MLSIISEEIILHGPSEVNQTLLILNAVVARSSGWRIYASTPSGLPMRSQNPIRLRLQVLLHL
jgi:hypothetical protein